MLEKINWYKDWFNSPFYHILYKNRDLKDAKLLIDNLIKYLNPSNEAKVLDLACGKGRHAIYLNQAGFDTIGLDMSINSINEAKIFENEKLKFIVGDMRAIPFQNEFDLVFNLFTSFGYFDNQEDNIRTLQSVFSSLKNNGTFVLDFFNTNKVIKTLITDEVKVAEEIAFKINRKVADNIIIKTIHFEFEGEVYSFEERVEALTLSDIQGFAEKSGFLVTDVFGSYQLEDYHAEQSDRMIFIMKKANA